MLESNPRLIEEGSSKYFVWRHELWRYHDAAADLPHCSRYRPVRFPYALPLSRLANLLTDDARPEPWNVPSTPELNRNRMHSQYRVVSIPTVSNSNNAESSTSSSTTMAFDGSPRISLSDRSSAMTRPSSIYTDSYGEDASIDDLQLPPSALASSADGGIAATSMIGAASSAARDTSTGDESGIGISEGELTDDILFESYTPASRPLIDLQLGALTLRRRLFGANHMYIPVPPVIHLLVSEILHPFYLFQIGSVTLWCFEQYYIYAGAIVFMSCLSAIVSVYQTRRNLFSLRDLANYSCIVTVFRNTEWRTTRSIPNMLQCTARSDSFVIGARSITQLGRATAWRHAVAPGGSQAAMRRSAARRVSDRQRSHADRRIDACGQDCGRELRGR